MQNIIGKSDQRKKLFVIWILLIHRHPRLNHKTSFASIITEPQCFQNQIQIIYCSSDFHSYYSRKLSFQKKPHQHHLFGARIRTRQVWQSWIICSRFLVQIAEMCPLYRADKSQQITIMAMQSCGQNIIYSEKQNVHPLENY